MMGTGILPGLSLADFTPDIVADADRTLLVAVTEKRTDMEISAYIESLGEALTGVAQGDAA